MYATVLPGQSGSMDAHTRTRVSLHAVAEGVLAGPQYERSGTIRLRVLQGGFGTITEPGLRVSGTDVVASDGRRAALTGTPRELAEALGVSYCVPDLYGDHAELGPHDPIAVDDLAAARIAAWFERGRQALVTAAPGQQPVLWPEHFDLAVTADEVNLGVSPGDGFSADPYAYVGPWDFDAAAQGYADSPFWSAPFGAVLPMAAAPDADALARFFRTGLTFVAQRRRQET